MLLNNLSKLEIDHKRKLLIMLKSFTYSNMLKLQKEKVTATVKEKFVKIADKAKKVLKTSQQESIAKRLEEINLNYREISDIIIEEEGNFANWDETSIENEILLELGDITECKDNTLVELNRKAIVEAAKGYKLEVEGYHVNELTKKVLGKLIEDISVEISRELVKTSEDQTIVLGAFIDEQLGKLDESDFDVMKKVLKFDVIDSSSIIGLFKTKGKTLLPSYDNQSIEISLYLSLTVLQGVWGILLEKSAFVEDSPSLISLFSSVLMSPIGWLLITGGLGNKVLTTSAIDIDRKVMAITVVFLSSVSG